MIYAGFSTTNHLLSKIIRWVTKSQASHCFAVFDWTYEGETIPMVLEATLEGVRMIPLDAFKTKNTVVAQVPLQGVEFSKLKTMFKYVGESYDFGGLLGAGVVQIGRWFKRRWSNPFASKSALFCSEALVEILQDLEWPGANKLVPTETSPQDLLEFLNVKVG